MSYFTGDSKLVDGFGNQAEVGLFGALKVSNGLAQISLTFDHPLNTDVDVGTAATGTGTTAAQYNRSLLRVKSGGTGTASVGTKATLRYRPATTIECNFTAAWIGSTGASDEALIGL